MYIYCIRNWNGFFWGHILLDVSQRAPHWPLPSATPCCPVSLLIPLLPFTLPLSQGGTFLRLRLGSLSSLLPSDHSEHWEYSLQAMAPTFVTLHPIWDKSWAHESSCEPVVFTEFSPRSREWATLDALLQITCFSQIFLTKVKTAAPTQVLKTEA